MSANHVVFKFQKNDEVVAANRIVSFCGTICVFEFVKISRRLAVVENDLLIKLVEIVEHNVSEPAEIWALPRFASKAFRQNFVQLRSHRLDGNTVHHIAHESVNQHLPRGIDANPARAQIKHRLFIKLADGCAVRAFHVVGKNFQLGLGIDGGCVRKQ